MLRLVLKQMRYDRTNTGLTVLALAAAIAVVVVLQGFEQGQYMQLQRVVWNRGSDLIAVQAKVRNFIATRSVIPQLVRQQVEETPGVVEVHPLTTLPIIYKNDGMQTPIYLVIFDNAGGPTLLEHTTTDSTLPGIVIDQSLLRKYQLKLGDSFQITNFAFQITGITQEAAFMMPFAFIDYDGLIDLFLESEIAPDLSTFPLLSFLLIDVDPSVSKAQVRKALEQHIPEIDVLTPTELAHNDVALGKGFYKPILGLLISVGFVLGLLLISLLMYSSIQRNQRDFSVMRALGFRVTHLLRYTFFLSSLLLLLALALGLALADGIAALIESARPVYYFAIFQGTVLIKVVSMVVLFAVLGALLPYFSLRRCDPVTALRSAT